MEGTGFLSPPTKNEEYLYSELQKIKYKTDETRLIMDTKSLTESYKIKQDIDKIMDETNSWQGICKFIEYCIISQIRRDIHLKNIGRKSLNLLIIFINLRFIHRFKMEIPPSHRQKHGTMDVRFYLNINNLNGLQCKNKLETIKYAKSIFNANTWHDINKQFKQFKNHRFSLMILHFDRSKFIWKAMNIYSKYNPSKILNIKKRRAPIVIITDYKLTLIRATTKWKQCPSGSSIKIENFQILNNPFFHSDDRSRSRSRDSRNPNYVPSLSSFDRRRRERERGKERGRERERRYY